MKIVSPSEINANREAYLIVDIREPYEYELSNINTLNIPMAEVCEKVNELPADTTIVLMCQSGNRALALGNLLTVDFDLPNIAVMEGGISAWNEYLEKTTLID